MHKIYLLLILILGFHALPAQETLPPTNQAVIDYTRSVIGQKVGRGECWDLADQALTSANARFDKSSKKTLYIFGKEYDPRKKPVLPGDIIQFRNVQVSYTKGNMIMKESYGHHTAIVYDVIEEGHLKLAHQNTGFSGKKVGVSDLRLEDVKKGKMKFYRPIPN